MRILVTGGAGFIGSYFVDMLLSGELEAELGAGVEEVRVLDALTYAGVEANLKGARGDARFRFIRGDIGDGAAVRGALDGVDTVVHFAAESHVDRSVAAAPLFTQTNVVGSAVLWTEALTAGIRRAVHVSTDEVYGSIADGSWAEGHILEPSSPYSASKAGSDLIALSLAHTSGLPLLVTRCTNNFGPRQFPEKIIPRFVTALLKGESVPLYGDGSARRDWLHVADHCRGVALALSRGRAGRIYNLGGGTELSALELTRRILEQLGQDESRIRWVADRPGHDLRYSVEDARARAELGYAPRTEFAPALAETIQWYVDNPAWWKAIDARAAGGAGREGPK